MFEIKGDGITKETIMLDLEQKDDNLRLTPLDGSEAEVYVREK